MATAFVTFAAPGRGYRRLVQGRWMVTSFSSAPVLRAGAAAQPAPGADQRLCAALRRAACPPI